MSHFYISPTIGDGTYDNMFRPLGMDTDSGAASINLGNLWLIWVPEAITDNRLLKVAENERDSLSTRVREDMESKLSISIPSGKGFGQTWFDLMKAGTVGGGLRPSVLNARYEVVIAGRVLGSEPAEIESRSQRFAEPLGELFHLGWTDIVGTFTDNSGVLEMTHDVAQTNLYARFEIPCDSPDSESIITIAVRAGGLPKIGAGAVCRMDESNDATFYYFGVRSTMNESEFGRLDNGMFNLIGSRTSISEPVDDTFRCVVDGSTMIGEYNGVEHVNTTDGNLPGNVKCGLYGRTGSSAAGMRTDISFWLAADLLLPTLFPVRHK